MKYNLESKNRGGVDVPLDDASADCGHLGQTQPNCKAKHLPGAQNIKHLQPVFGLSWITPGQSHVVCRTAQVNEATLKP